MLVKEHLMLRSIRTATSILVTVLRGAALFGVVAAVVGSVTYFESTRPPGNSAIYRMIGKQRIEISTAWSGYVAAMNLAHGGRGSVTDVQGQWMLPALQCGGSSPNPAYSSIWVGIDGFPDNDTTVEQLGVDLDCIRGAPQYHPWYEMLPRDGVYLQPASMRTQAGDVIFTEVKYAGNNTFQLIMKNLTTGQKFSVTQSLAAARETSAEWIVERPAPIDQSMHVVLSNFGTLTFTKCQATIGGVTGGINEASWTYQGVLMRYRPATAPVVNISPVSADGRIFSLTWAAR